MDAKDLAAKIASAERERAVWNAGRRAFRDEGAMALNPHAPLSPDHTLWAEGFEAEREATKAPIWAG